MKVTRRLCLILTTLLAVTTSCTRVDISIADFEGEDYGDWKVTGEAFGPGPAKGSIGGQMEVSGFKGKRLVNSFFKGDGSVGTLTSPPFQIQRPFINFLVGGGMHPGETCVNLIVGEKTVRTATGPNDKPGGSERLDWHTWNVGDLNGKKAVLQIVDKRKSGWGHINIDHIVQSDRKLQAPPPPPELPAHREILIERPFLHIPVKTKAPKRRMKFTLDGETVREFDIELADGEPGFLVFSDITAFRGKRLRIEVDKLPEGSEALSAIVQADTVPNPEGLYKEKHRQQFHFSSRRGWNNDPNGLVYHKGEYHLYYQHNPYGWAWGNMHWGHAVSRDLVHWKELPIAIYPYKHGDWVFSGSAAVDWNNTAGFKTGDEDVIVAAYTSTGRGEAIAYSNDRGRTFTDYEGNPVVEHKGRDPKIIWYAPGKHWVMAVYNIVDKSKGIAFHTSPDLKNWTFQSRIDGYFECPEIFELPVDGDPNDTRWVVYGANGQYALGRFDGKVFTPETEKLKGHYGNCFYASQTYTDIPASDGRRIQIGWGQTKTFEMPFNQCMLFPCELTLRTTDEGIRMYTFPVKEIETIHKKRYKWKLTPMRPGDNPMSDIEGDLFHIRAEFEPAGAREFGFRIRGVPIVYNVEEGELSCLNRKASLIPEDGKIRLEVLVDRVSIEIYANGGRVYMPIHVIPEDDERSLEVYTEGGETNLLSLEVYPLRSIWK